MVRQGLGSYISTTLHQSVIALSIYTPTQSPLSTPFYKIKKEKTSDYSFNILLVIKTEYKNLKSDSTGNYYLVCIFTLNILTMSSNLFNDNSYVYFGIFEISHKLFWLILIGWSPRFVCSLDVCNDLPLKTSSICACDSLAVATVMSWCRSSSAGCFLLFISSGPVQEEFKIIETIFGNTLTMPRKAQKLSVELTINRVSILKISPEKTVILNSILFSCILL